MRLMTIGERMFIHTEKIFEIVKKKSCNFRGDGVYLDNEER